MRPHSRRGKPCCGVRTFIYFGIWGAIGAAMLFALGTRTHTDLTGLARPQPALYAAERRFGFANAYTLRLRNMEARPRDMEVALTGLPEGAIMWTDAVARENAAPEQVIASARQRNQGGARLCDAAAGARAPMPSPSALTSLDEQREQDVAETTFGHAGGASNGRQAQGIHRQAHGDGVRRRVSAS